MEATGGLLSLGKTAKDDTSPASGVAAMAAFTPNPCAISVLPPPYRRRLAIEKGLGSPCGRTSVGTSAGPDLTRFASHARQPDTHAAEQAMDVKQ